jgi:tRNA (cytidine/uridine-2'-O-)-methyltransferase
LHLIEPLGFALDDRALKRAGLDYHEYASIITHANYRVFNAALTQARIFALSTHADNSVFDARFEAGDVFLFGPETRGLPGPIRDSFAPERLLRLPMTRTSRSLNLSNAVAVVVYEAWRQCGFIEAE